MDNETTYSVQDLIKHSYDQKPVEFEQAFNSLIGDRIAQAVDARKLEVAQTMFDTESEEDEINTEQETDTEETTDGETA